MGRNIGDAPPPKGKGRAVLSVRSPLVENLLAGINYDETNLDALRSLGKALVQDRNRWDVARRGSGIFHSGRIARPDADAALSRALASMAGGGQ